jgi:hypothetical protein
MHAKSSAGLRRDDFDIRRAGSMAQRIVTKI